MTNAVPPIIREAVPADQPAVAALWQACGLVASYNDPAKDFRAALAGPGSTVLVAESRDGRLVGTVMAGDDGHRGWLYYVAADPAERGCGIGRRMVEAGERWLRQRGVPKVQLMVRETNAAAAAFYRRLGYEETPRILMAKWLDDRS